MSTTGRWIVFPDAFETRCINIAYVGSALCHASPRCRCLFWSRPRRSRPFSSGRLYWWFACTGLSISRPTQDLCDLYDEQLHKTLPLTLHWSDPRTCEFVSCSSFRAALCFGMHRHCPTEGLPIFWQRDVCCEFKIYFFSLRYRLTNLSWPGGGFPHSPSLLSLV